MSELEHPTAPDALNDHAAFSKCDWNLPQLLDRLEADQDLLRELLLLFQHDAPGNLLKAKQALAEEDLQELSRAAHTLRGMLRTLSMNVASESAAHLEEAARNQNRNESTNLLGQLEHSLEELRIQVDAWLAKVRP